MTAVDVWGAIFKAEWAGEVSRYEIERDDGCVEALESAANYMVAPRSEAERELLDRLEGPVLDLAAGAGAYARYFQDRGLEVTAADSSPGALEVCRARGCRKVVAMDLRSVDVEPASFGSVIVMGNTLGAHQTPESLPELLRTLRRAVKPRGHLLFTMIDPLDTTNESHLRYQRKNRERGLPPGLIRMRVKFDGYADDWINLWMLTDDELVSVASDAGWRLSEERRRGYWRITLLEAPP